MRKIMALLIMFILFSGFACGIQRSNASKQAAKNGLGKEGCTTIIVGKGASADGSVLLGHNEELGDRTAIHIHAVPRMEHAPDEVIVTFFGAKVPQVTETYAYVTLSAFDEKYVPGDFAAGINEYQVAVANNLAYSKETWLRKMHGWHVAKTGDILWSEFMEIALERARTAEEAVLVMGSLAEQYGLGCDPGTMFGITDPNEGWWIEIGFKHWVAKKIPDNAAEMRANYFRIGTEFDLSSPGVIEFAVEQGWYDPTSGKPFNWTEAYGDTAGWGPRQYLRHWRVESLLGEYTPDGVSISEVMAILRDHYEGTAYDTTNLYEYGSPHRTPYRTICRDYTVESFVAQSRSWMPSEIGGVMWTALTSPCTSVYVPWYMGITDTPQAYQVGTNGYDRNSAWWAFERLSDVVDKEYGDRVQYVQDLWREFEEQEFQEVEAIEGLAMELYMDGKVNEARAILTAYSCGKGIQAMEQAIEMVSMLKTYH